MSFYSDQVPFESNQFPDFTPMEFLSENELIRTCRLAKALGNSSAVILFSIQNGSYVCKATDGILDPGYWVQFLASLPTNPQDSFSRFEEPKLFPSGLKYSIISWIRDRNGKILGGIGLFFEHESKLEAEKEDSLQLLGQNLLDSWTREVQIHQAKSFEKVFHFSNDFVCVVDFQGIFEKINPAFTSILGWTRDQISGQNFSAFIYPEDLQETQEIFGQLVQGQSVSKFVHRFLTSKGDFRIIQWTSTVDLDAERIYAIGRDVTEEKALENELNDRKTRFREFFENSQGLMCTHDLEGRFLTVNPAGASMVGYSPQEILTKSLFDLVPVEHHEGIHYYLDQIRSTGKMGGQMYVRHKDGSVRTWVFNNVLHVPISGGESYVIGNAIDISARAALEKDLKITKTLLEETGKVARVGGWELDLINNQILWTPVTRLIHEVPEDYIPNLVEGINFYKEGENREKIAHAVTEAIEKGTPWSLDLQIITAKQNLIWVRAIGKAIQENGVTTRLVGTFQDIDLAKKTELEAASAKKLLVDVLDASSEVSIIASDTTGLITVFNKGAEKLLGYSAEEMIGKQTPSIFHLQEEMEAHGKSLSMEFGRTISGMQIFMARAEKFGSEKMDWTYVCKNGEKRLVELVVTPIRDLNQVTIGYLGVATDITAKREVELALNNERSRLSAFVKHTPAAVAMLDRELNYLAISNRWVQEFKLEESQVIGKSHYDLFAEIITEESYEWHRKVLNGEVVGRQEEKVTIPGTEEAQYISWEMRPWYLYGGEIGGMMILSQNVTGMVKRREELQLAKIQAEEASRAKSEFLANMSHEIRTPLNGVIGFTDLVLKTKLTDTQNQYLTIVNQSANALLGIINDILDFSKIEAGKLELDVEKSDLYELASQATDIITYQIQKKGLELLLNVDPDLPRFIYADSVRLKQVLVNLLGNASKFTEKGEIELRIQALEKLEGQFRIRFAVRDTGIGIHPDKQAKIFEAFSQEDSSTTKKYGGTGLGLTISNKLLGLMDSKLQLESSLGRGSTFFFDVTFDSEQGDPIEWVGLESIQQVLVVDDNENNRIIVSQMLRLKNIQTTEATNGFEALQLLANGKKFDVVLMDYHMPFMDGIETIRKIRETFEGHLEEMPILLLHSSSDDARIIQACKDFGIKFRLIKPLKIQELYHALAHLAEKSEPKEFFQEDQLVISKPFKILIAEDNPINMLLAETILHNCLPNVQVIKAENGQEALDSCRLAVPDLILMDVQMPVMNGYEATQSIRKLLGETQVPIIALTAGNVKGEREKCLDAGMDDFVVKPVVESTLKMILGKWLNLAPDESSEERQVLDQTLHFNPQNLKSYAEGNVEFLQRIFSIVKGELNHSYEEMERGKKSKSLIKAKEAGHKLYGTSVSSGFGVLAHLSKDLELKEVWVESEMISLMNQIQEEIKLVLGLLEGE